MENIQKLIHKKFKQTWNDKIPKSYSQFEKMIKKQNKFIFDRKTKTYKSKSTVRTSLFRDRVQLSNYIESNPYYIVGKKMAEEGVDTLNESDIAIILSTFTHEYDGRDSIFHYTEPTDGRPFFEGMNSDGIYDHAEQTYSSNVTDFLLKKFLLGSVLYTFDLVEKGWDIWAKVLFYMPEKILATVNILDEFLSGEIDLTLRSRMKNYSWEVNSNSSELYYLEPPVDIEAYMSSEEYINETMSRLVTAKLTCVDEYLNDSSFYDYSDLLPSTILVKLTNSDFIADEENETSLNLYIENKYDYHVLMAGRFFSESGEISHIMKNPFLKGDGKLNSGPIVEEDVSFNVKDYITSITSVVLFVVNGMVDPRSSEFYGVPFWKMYCNPYSSPESASSIQNGALIDIPDTDLSKKRFAGFIFHTDMVKKIPTMIFDKEFVTDSKEIKNRLGEISTVQFNSVKEFFAFFTGESVDILNLTYEEPEVHNDDKTELTKLFATTSSEIISVVNSISSNLTASVSFEPVEIEQFGEDVNAPYNQVYKQNFIVYNASNFSVNPSQSIGLFVTMFKKTLESLAFLLKNIAIVVSETLKTLFELLVRYIDVILKVSVRSFLRLITTTSVTKIKYMASETFNDSTYVIIPSSEISIPDRFKQSMLNNYLLGSVQEVIIIDRNVAFVIKHITEFQYVVNFAAIKFFNANFGLGFYVESCITKEDWGTSIRSAFTQLINEHSLDISLNQFNEFVIIENEYKALSRGILDGTVSHIPIIGKFVGTTLSIQFILSTLTSAELSDGFLQVFGINYEQYVELIISLKYKNYNNFSIIETEDYLLTIQELQTGMNVIVEEQGVFHSTIDSLVAYWAGRKLAHLFYLIARRIRYRKTIRLNKSSIVEPLKEGQQELNESGLENSILILAALTTLGTSLTNDISNISDGDSIIYDV